MASGSLPPAASRARRGTRDEELKERIQQAHTPNHRVRGARKAWRELNGQGHAAARCGAERLMRETATAEWADRYCHRRAPRLHGSTVREATYVPPAGCEANNRYMKAMKPQVATTNGPQVGGVEGLAGRPCHLPQTGPAARRRAVLRSGHSPVPPTAVPGVGRRREWSIVPPWIGPRVVDDRAWSVG
ncbi:IS3 family transposase [Streptomyces sp. NPDC058257]|uniref:IS3 family transposase n=1 Tax=Streptomyces sp. NPDC058257 TaxID=3346409 RepID=UPI0036ECBF50